MQLQQGESAIKNAPIVALPNGHTCIPQHYLLFKHSRESVEKIVLDINFYKDYPIFVGLTGEGIYIQVGVIGFDNYNRKQGNRDKSIVYGRKWRVEENLSTSEIIQTIFLAIKIAREHEIRELFTLTHHKKVSTVFNTHQDLPVLSKLQHLFEKTQTHATVEQLQLALESIEYDKAHFSVVAFEQRGNGSWLLDIEMITSEHTSLPELNLAKDTRLTLVIKSPSINSFFHGLFDALLALSNDYVTNNFSYQGFTLFDKKNSVVMIADILITQRKRTALHLQEEFSNNFKHTNHEIDKTRVPKLYQGKLADKIK
ncbi:hypothetical protein [Psychromonas sp. Urea-02u-13]|uniref:hypothetical protein n=1 Tax=Psychromonas sp. Urea-02u-13 TaxID=2058326 RepID=UPI000C3401E8|nr:hypothetical protein [Psychromonas sp. Urea-02u-13]PKG40667.1 hypothetical protein CXF74_02300 [Psychromonas sp. Urea-02u-13]